MPRIEQWSVCFTDPYAAPEVSRPSVQGNVYGREPRFPDGHPIQTSTIVKVEGKYVTTKSGTVYELGEPDPDYVTWCLANGFGFDRDNPLRIKKA